MSFLQPHLVQSPAPSGILYLRFQIKTFPVTIQCYISTRIFFHDSWCNWPRPWITGADYPH